MIIQNVKGGYDYLPKEQKIRNYINRILTETFEQFGYSPIETPILCYYDILKDKYSEDNDILKEIYKLYDQGNRKLGLRYDLTVPFAKFIALNKNEIQFPFKRYEIAKVFRDGPVKRGRDREFTQCDVDVVGCAGREIEAELISLYVQAFKKLDIEIEIKYNNRKLMVGILKECNVNENDINNIITIVDKINKVCDEDFDKMLKDNNMKENDIIILKKYFKYNLKELNKEFKKSNNTLLTEGLNEINELADYLERLNINYCCSLDTSLARGQDYYTGNVFEVYDKNKDLTSSIGGGGRYDKMITEFIDDGCIYPAVGISFGLTSLFELLKNRPIFKNNSVIDLFIIPINTEIESLELANKIRKLGINAEVDYTKNKIKKALDKANKNNIPYVIILGEDEIKKGMFRLKDMNNCEEFEIAFNDLDRIKEIII